MSFETGKKIAASMVASTMEWLDADTAKLTVNECLQFVKKATRALNQADLSEMKPKDISQMVAYAVKYLDEAARLVQFSQGAPDSRQEVTIGQLFPLLTAEEVAVLAPALQRLQNAQDTGAVKQSELH